MKKWPMDKEINGIIEKHNEINKARHKTNLFFIYISYLSFAPENHRKQVLSQLI